MGGAKLLLVLGHTRCGAITESVSRLCAPASPQTAACEHLQEIVEDIHIAIDEDLCEEIRRSDPVHREHVVNRVARRNVEVVMDRILRDSRLLREMAANGRIAVVGGMYDVTTGEVSMFAHPTAKLELTVPAG